MEYKEFQLHNIRRQLVKVVRHVHDSRKFHTRAVQHIRLCGHFSDQTIKIENLLQVTEILLNQTISLAAAEMQRCKSLMESPNANPPPVRGGNIQSKLTPLQRALTRAGHLNIDHVPTHYVPTKTELRTPIIPPFHLTKRKNPKKHYPNPPL